MDSGNKDKFLTSTNALQKAEAQLGKIDTENLRGGSAHLPQVPRTDAGDRLH